uniref:CLK4 associating serine/arginine rich protein n=1 Tax=Apteryx owenii TaxID=8824 RepID=A0A8B9PDP6_APTOW
MRFRYECEGRSAGSILGESSTDASKTLPAIELLNCQAIPEVKVTACLVWKDWPYRVHPHGLVGKDCSNGLCEVVLKPQTNPKHSFSNLGIQCVKKKEIETAIEKKLQLGIDPFKAGSLKNHQEVDMNVVRICFQASYQDSSGQTQHLSPVLSDPIFDKKSTNTSELRICRMNKESGPCTGGEELYLLCDKVQKEDIAVVFRKETWEARADFSQADVHRQVAIVFKTPPYQHLELAEPVEVEVFLQRLTDSVCSESFRFTYLPKDHDAYGVNVKRKRGMPDVLEELSGSDPYGIEAKRRKKPPGYMDHFTPLPVADRGSGRPRRCVCPAESRPPASPPAPCPRRRLGSSTMWHEARKHERKLRGMMVDYKKRAERRREYYEKIKKDPAQFLQVHGRACKVHLDSAVALAAESPVNMMPWQGDTNNMIDRFDVRAHLDYIPMYTPPLLNPISPEQESDERKCNYERYRGLVQNDFAGISEEQCLYQIYIDELYGGLQKPNEDEKKKLAEKKASIGYTYEDSTVAELENSLEKRGDEEDSEEDSNTDEDEVIPDIDVEVDVDELNQEQVADLNKQATTYGMAEGDFVRMLRKDKEEAEAIKHAKALEEEKAMYSGRRSRRQRREFREKRLKGRKISPPRSPSESTSESRSRSRSPSPGHEEKITFITSFGGSDEEAAAAQAGGVPGKPASLGKQRSAPGQPGSAAAGHSASSRRRSSSSSTSPSSSSSSSSRSSSRSHRGGGYHRSSRYCRSHSRRYSRSRSRSRRYSGGGSRDSRRRSRSYSPDRGYRYSSRRRSRSRSRSGERYRRSGRSSRHWSSSPSSRSPSDSRSRSKSMSPVREKPLRPAASPAVGEKLKKADTAAGKETGAAKPKLTPQEKLKLRMQKALNRQFKADKKAAQEKMLQQEHERQGERAARERAGGVGEAVQQAEPVPVATIQSGIQLLEEALPVPVAEPALPPLRARLRETLYSAGFVHYVPLPNKEGKNPSPRRRFLGARLGAVGRFQALPFCPAGSGSGVAALSCSRADFCLCRCLPITLGCVTPCVGLYAGLLGRG